MNLLLLFLIPCDYICELCKQFFTFCDKLKILLKQTLRAGILSQMQTIIALCVLTAKDRLY